MASAGDKAPEFRLLTEDREEFTNADIAGKRVVFCFFPFAFSGVCNDQFSAYRVAMDEFSLRAVELYAISVDSWHSQRAFREHLGVTGITFLNDFEPKGAVAKAFDTYREQGFNDRSVIVIEPDGTISWATKMPTPGEYPPAEDVLAGLDSAAS